MTRTSLVPQSSPIYTSLPASPVDGQVIDFLADAANGIVWRLRYRAASSSAYKWEYLGGPELRGAVDTIAGTGGTGSSYSELSGSPGPDVIVPLAGDYDCILGACVQNSANTVNTSFGVCIGVTAQATVVASTATLGGGGAWNPTWFQDRVTGVAAGTTLRVRYQYTSIIPNYGYRRLYVRPIRVG